jgi:hypothetical protein
MWLLESAKHQILGVDTPGQHVPPRVWYGMACELIRNTIACVSCLEEWELTWYYAQAHMMQEGHVGETLALQAGPVRETVAKHDIPLYYTFITACSDRWAIHQRKCKEWQN